MHAQYTLPPVRRCAPPAGVATPNVGASGVRSRRAVFAAHPSARSYPGFPAWLRSRKADSFNTVFTDMVGAGAGLAAPPDAPRPGPARPGPGICPHGVPRLGSQTGWPQASAFTPEAYT